MATASDANRVLAVFQSMEGVDLAILDYHLPGEDGYQLFQKLRSLHTGVRVLMASGFLASDELACLQQGGPGDYL